MLVFPMVSGNVHTSNVKFVWDGLLPFGAVSHLGPLYPRVHSHLYPSPSRLQVPPFLHGDGKQGSVEAILCLANTKLFLTPSLQGSCTFPEGCSKVLIVEER